jgi:hypothetical protein
MCCAVVLEVSDVTHIFCWSVGWLQALWIWPNSTKRFWRSTARRRRTAWPVPPPIHRLRLVSLPLPSAHVCSFFFHRMLAAARVMVELNAANKSAASKLAATIDASSTIQVRCTLLFLLLPPILLWPHFCWCACVQSCEAAHKFLQESGEGADAFKKAALARFPYTPSFGAVSQVPAAAADAPDAKDAK